MRKALRLFALCALCAIALCGCASQADSPIVQLSDVTTHRIGVQTGSVYDALVTERFPQAIPVYFATSPDALLALKTGKIDAIVNDEPILRVMAAGTDGIVLLDESLEKWELGFAYQMDNTALKQEMDGAVQALKDNGVYAALENEWLLSDDESQRQLDAVKVAGERGALHVAMDPTSPPFSYLRDGEIVGFDVELLRYATAMLGYDMVIDSMDFGAIVPAVSSGKSDIGASSVFITEERAKAVLFSEPYYLSGCKLAVRGAAAASRGFFATLGESFVSTFVTESRYLLILQGLGTTLTIFAGAALLGTLLGACVCAARRSGRRWLGGLAKGYIFVIQGTPLVVLLMILYYVLFADSPISPTLVAILGFGMNTAAYVAEMMRAGVDAVDPGQIEAARASGFGRGLIYRKLIIPQATRTALPVYRGEMISLLKMTSIVGYISISDLTRMSDLIRSRTYEAFFPLISTALIYLLVCCLLVRLLRWAELRVDPGHRARKVKGVRMQ